MGYVKCKICEESSDKITMVKVGSRYVHPECKRKADIEQEQKNELYDYIMIVHEIKTIPNSFFYLMTDLRNGTIRRGRTVIKKDKRGYPYDTILAAYKKYTANIRFSMSKINFKNTTNMLRYTYAIIIDNIASVERNMKKIKARKKEEERLFNAKTETTTKTKYKKQNNNDISEFID